METGWHVTGHDGGCWLFPGDDLMRCVDLYNQAQSKWFEEMVTTTLVCEQMVKRLVPKQPWVVRSGHGRMDWWLE